MKENTLRELFLDELRDLYDAENRIVKALPKMAKASNSEELRSGFEEHLEQTKEHVERLKQIFSDMDEKASGKKCPGMVGIIQEGDELMDEDFEGSVADAALISAAQRVELTKSRRTDASAVGRRNWERTTPPSCWKRR
ncbi:MAG TPA: DUF892 family protein [Candidatus Eremiobacteraceae bacterium]|nr:DUF892 family protein [Candidatus Eremiobacteraceae bacterium]